MAKAHARRGGRRSGRSKGHRSRIVAGRPANPARSSDSEIVFGLAAGAGTPLELVQRLLIEELKTLRYRAEVLHLSELTRHFQLSTGLPRSSVGEAARIDAMMNRGNEARSVTRRNDILALAAIGDIRFRRGAGALALRNRAFVLRQLKHPDEVFLLRRTYGDGFHLVGVYCPRKVRERELRRRGVRETDVRRLVERDEHEPSDSGQHLRDTFHLADVFIEVADDEARLAAQLRRFLRLLFGLGITTPSRDEFGMFQAFANSLRSSQLGRQVGAAILTPAGDLVSVGTNEVPRHGGGVYWDGDKDDQRDHARGRDSSDELREEIVCEITERLNPGLSASARRRLVAENLEKLRATTITDLTEFGRAVHAEAEAILSAARRGVAVRGGRRYCTTFPCHVCAKHIVGAGIEQVTFIEPYPKSRALALHHDAIALEDSDEARVTFRPFVGVAPRRFVDLFSMRSAEGSEIRRKDPSGRPVLDQRNLRLQMPYHSALDREDEAAEQLLDFIDTRGGRR